MSTSDKPPASDRQPLPTFEEDEQPTESNRHVPAHEGEQQYDEHGQPYAEEHEQHYDEHGQPYAEEHEQQYDEHGQPYAEEHEQHYDEHGQPYAEEHAQQYDEHEHYEAPTQHVDAYPTTPQFTGPPPPYSRRPLGPPHSHPYRVPVPPEPATVPHSFKPLNTPPKPRPVLGAALATYGVLLWSFVVAGQFATSWITGSPMSNGMAVFIVLAATTTAWVLALRRARVAAPVPSLAHGVSRGIGVLAASGLMFFVTIIVATIAGQVSTRNHDFAIAFFLVLAAVTATIVGPQLTLPVRPERTHGARFALVSIWIVGAIVTFIAGAELATNG